jgi:hypothetical protein
MFADINYRPIRILGVEVDITQHHCNQTGSYAVPFDPGIIWPEIVMQIAD